MVGRFFARSVIAVALVAAMILGARAASAQTPEPDDASTARLLGYLWADGTVDGGVWDASAPSGARSVIERLVDDHGGSWVDRRQLKFRLPAPYNWADWKDGLPKKNADVRRAVQSPHFLAALLEGEGQTSGQIYDQSSCCTRGFTRGRLTELLALLRDRGYESATLTQFADVDSGEITISGSDIDELRAQLRFVCPANSGAVRIPGGEQYGTHGPIRWFDSTTRWSSLLRTDCASGTQISPVSPGDGSCTTADVGEGRVRLSWTFLRGDVSISRDGMFQRRTSARDKQWIDVPGAGIHSYSLTSIFEGASTGAGCGSVAAGVPTTILCRGRVVTIRGTDQAETIWGTEGGDVIDAGAGNDLIHALGGDDVVCAGAGADRIEGGDGRDVVAGGTGWDRITGGAGADALIGGPGNDTVFGGGGNDRISGGLGDDTLSGNNGNDRLRGRGGNDTINGGSLNDVCDGGPGQDILAHSCETVFP